MTTDLIVARAALRDAVRPRRLLLVLLLVLLPPFVGLLWHQLAPASAFHPDVAYEWLVIHFEFGFTLSLLSVVYGTGIVAQELEQRTIVYLLTRPLPRWRLMLSKIIVNVFLVTAITALSTLLLAVSIYGTAHFGDADFGLDLKALAVGAVTYGCLFLLLGTLLSRPLIYGLLFVFGWETILPILPGSFARYSIMSYLRVVAARPAIEAAPGSDNPAGNFLASINRPPDIDISNHLAWFVLFGVSAVALGLSLYFFSTREYVPREEAD